MNPLFKGRVNGMPLIRFESTCLECVLLKEKRSTTLDLAACKNIRLMIMKIIMTVKCFGDILRKILDIRGNDVM